MAGEKLTTKQIKVAILNLKNQVPKEKQEVAGVEVWVHGLTSYELEDWRLVRNNPDAVDTRLSTAKLLQLALRDEAGTRIFSEKELALIGGLPAKDIEPLSRTAMKLSGYGVEAEEAILKNLVRTLGVDGLSELLGNISAASPNSSKDTQDGN